MDACTIASRRELSRARVLVATFRQHHPDGSFTVLLLDVEPEGVEIEGARVHGLTDVLGGDDAGLLLAGNSPDTVALALLPHLIGLLARGGSAASVYLGSGLRVLAPLTRMAELLDSHPLVLVARAIAPPPMGLFSGDGGRGVFTDQLVGVRPSHLGADLVSSWPRYFSDDDAGTAAAHAWLNSVPTLARDLAIVRAPGYGADPWTLARVPLDPDSDVLSVAGDPVVTFDFSSMDSSDPLGLFDGRDRVDLSSAPALEHLAIVHAKDLLAAGADGRAEPQTSSFVELGDGTRMTPLMRGLLIEGIERGELAHSPLADPGRQEFLAYLASPATRGADFGLMRVHTAIWEQRHALRASYPHIDGPDGAEYAGWLCRYGQEQEGLGPSLLPPVPEVALREAAPGVHEDPPRWGVNVAGFFTAELGVGEAARLLMAGLDARGIPALPIQGHLAPPSRQGVAFPFAMPDQAAYPINIMCINGDGIPVFAREAGRAFFEQRHTIALWWWEVGEPPRTWQQAYEFVDEIWVGSQHIYDLVAPSSPVPVVKVTLPVLMPQVAEVSRAELGLPPDGFLFLFVHDYHSMSARKNPAGVIEAFKLAFPPDSGAKLLIKSINAPNQPGAHERILRAASGRHDITILDGYVSGPEKNAMIAHCDCYVSLHRSEGFGLTLAEAMMLGRPVIATAYGGTLEFTNEKNSYMVDWAPTEVGEGAGVYAPEAIWAEPDLDHAATLMRRVFDNRDEARERAQLAKREVMETHSPAVAGEVMERRLCRIHERLAEDGHRTLNLARAPASEAGAGYPEGLSTPPQVSWGEGPLARLRERAQRPLAHWIPNYLTHQGAIDSQIFDRLASLDSRVREIARTLVAQQQAGHAETLAVLRRMEAELASLRAGDQPLAEAEGADKRAPTAQRGDSSRA